MDTLFLASVNAYGLRAESRRSRLIRYLHSLKVSIACVQETRFASSDNETILSRDFRLFSAYFDGRSRGVSWLISKSLEVTADLVFADPAGRLCVVDITIKGEQFRLVGVYGPNHQRERIDFFQRIDQFLSTSKQVIIAGDFNAVLSPDIDRQAGRTNTINTDADVFRDFVDRMDLVDKYRNEFPNRREWTWTGRGGSGNTQLYSYIDRVLVRRADVGLLECPSFHSIAFSDHRLVRVRLKLGKSKPRMTGYWKLNAALLAEKNFQDQLTLIIKKELTGSVMGNKWWMNLKDKIRLFATDYSKRLNRERKAAQATMERRVNEAVTSGNAEETAIARAELASLLIKEDQGLVVRARLKKMSPEATNMATELCAEEKRRASDRHIASITSLDGRHLTTSGGICEEFRSYFQDLFTREPGLDPVQFDTYLADFPRLEATEAAGCEGRIREDEVREVLRTVGLDKTPGIDGLPYEVYCRLAPIFTPLLTTLFNHWLKQGSIPQRITRGVVKLLVKDKHGGDGIDNFRPLTMLNTELKILAKILANRLQGVLGSLIGPEQTSAVKGRTIQDNLHLVRTIVEKVAGNAAMIKLDQSKAFDRVDHRFMESILNTAGFGQDFRAWIQLLYATPSSMVEVNGVRSKPFRLSRSVRQGCPLSPMLYVLALEPFLRRVKANPVLRGITLPGTINPVTHTAYVDDVTMFVTNNAEILEVDKEIREYEKVAGAKINSRKSEGLRLGSWRGVPLPGPFRWTDGPWEILGVYFGPGVLLEKNWSEVLKKVENTLTRWSRRNLSLKGRAEVCGSHIYPLIVYQMSVLPLPCTVLAKLVDALYTFLWGVSRAPMVRREICQLHPSEGGLGMPDIGARLVTLRMSFLVRMYTEEEDGIGEIWKEDAKRAFPALRSVQDDGGEAKRLPRNQSSFYGECRRALRVFSRVKDRLSDTQSLSRKALYQVLVRAGVKEDEKIEVLGLTKEEKRSLWPWVPGLKCLNNNEASLTWLTIRSALWVGKRLFSAGLVDSPECKRCGDMEESLEHAFYHCSVVRSLCNLVEGYMVRALRRPFFALDASAICNNVTPSMEKKEKCVLLCLLGIM